MKRQLELAGPTPAIVDVMSDARKIGLVGSLSIHGELGGLDVSYAVDMRIDTGSMHSLVKHDRWRALGRPLHIKDDHPGDIKTASGERLAVSGRARIAMRVNDVWYKCLVYVVEGL